MNETEKITKAPDKLKMEVRTTLQTFLLATGVFSLVLIFIGYAQLQSGWSAALMIGATIYSVISLLCFFSIDNYYILDIKSRKLFYSSSFLLMAQQSEICDFSEIHAVTVNTSKVTGKGNTSYFYAAELVLDDGTVVPVSKPKPEKSDAVRLAAFISENTGAENVGNSTKSVMLPTQLESGRYSFVKESGLSKMGNFAEKLIAVIMILLGIPFIIAVILHLIKR